MKRLNDNVNSQYVEALNHFYSGKKKRIVAYVESYDDIAFWRLLLDEFEDDERCFQIMLPSRTNLTKGKKSAIRSCVQQCSLGKNMIACVDSDYDYLMQGTTETSFQILRNPFIIHTYAYAIENYKCYADSLHNICVQCTLNDRRVIDFNKFFLLYSQTVYPLFVWNVWFYRTKRHNRYSMQEFCRDINLKSINLKDPYSSIALLARRVDKKIAYLKRNYPDNIEEVEDLYETIKELGVNENNAYLFIRGHSMFELIMNKVLSPICTSLIAEREQEIYKYAVHTEQLNNELSAYRHSQMSLNDAIRKNTHYRDCELYERMREDIRAMLSVKEDDLLSLFPECRSEED